MTKIFRKRFYCFFMDCL